MHSHKNKMKIYISNIETCCADCKPWTVSKGFSASTFRIFDMADDVQMHVCIRESINCRLLAFCCRHWPLHSGSTTLIKMEL